MEQERRHKMSRKILLLLSFALLLIWSTLAFAGPNIQDGMWEITTKVDMQGMPAMPPMKYTQCMNSKDYIPQKEEKGIDCKITNNKATGDTVTWSVHCTDKNGTYDSTGKITYKGNSFSGVINMTVNDKREGKMQMTQQMTGKRIGDCK